MDEDEIKQAIENGKLPITIGDKIGVAFFIICLISLIAMGLAAYMDPNFKNFPGMLCGVSFGILYASYNIWQDFNKKN